ncbi:MAG: hypothetical protein NT167_03510 [Verrucomicrobia bacterium]|nr:hypothetical protein [Verrucomicrobiota bacterium]
MMIGIRWRAAFLIGFIKTVSRSQASTTLVIGCLVAASCPAFAQFSIARPNYGVPEFAETGGTFRVEVKASAGLTDTLWSAVLANDLRSWTGVVEHVDYGSYVDNNTLVGYALRVRVPADISPEVFKLVISHPAGGAATNRNAVSIVPGLETNFYILHYADPQAQAYEPNNADTGMYGTHGSIREMYWHAPAMRLINPRFMFDTGDELDNAYGISVARYQEYVDAMCQMCVPVLATRGNNDSEITVANWRTTIGIETYSLTMGSFYVCQKDYNANDYTAWFTNDYAASFTNPAIKYRLFGQHFIVGGAGWMPPAGQSPGLMLVGHGHVNSTLLSSPYYIIETQQACNKGAVGFFEFARGSTNWTCTSLTNVQAAQFQVMSAGAVARIANTFAYTNNGSCFTNTATIVNQIPNDFWDGRVRFLMKYSAAGYSVSNGVKLAEYAYNGNSNMAVVIKVNIAKSATTAVGIQPWLTLAVSGPVYGQSSPADGVYTNSFGTSFTVAVTNSPVIIGGATQYVCEGWTGSGSVPASGTGTNTGELTLTADSIIAWRWATNYCLATAASNGQVDVTNGWMSAGSNITVTALPDLYYHFAYWSGDVPSSQTNSNPLPLTMDRPSTIAATCSANQTTNGTPLWWLAKYALATNDAGALYDEGDGVPAWMEYMADTDPTNAASYFRMTGVTNLPPWTIYFDSSSDRAYTLSWCSNLVDGIWTNVPGQESREGVGGLDQMQDTNTSPGRFYRLKADLP